MRNSRAYPPQRRRGDKNTAWCASEIATVLLALLVSAVACNAPSPDDVAPTPAGGPGTQGPDASMSGGSGGTSGGTSASAGASNDGSAGEASSSSGPMGRDAGAADAPSAADASSASGDSGTWDAGSTARDPLQQPFASTSIWNMPIGSSAVYVPANIHTATGQTIEADPDIIVLTATAPSTDVYTNDNSWNAGDRCPAQGPLLFSAPIPSAFVLPSNTNNDGLAALLADGRTIRQSQPFARCTAGASATSGTWYVPDVDLYGDGILGAHGGSTLSAIGGTIRVGELRPGGQPSRHALKINLYGKENFYNDGVYADSYRWPATSSDGLANYGGNNPALKEGSLLALPPNVAIGSLGLSTEPAKMIAWTLQNYGAYVVDDSAWSAYALCTEHGPNGDFLSQFQSDWGFQFDAYSTTGPWDVDIQKVVSLLQVVDNNGSTSIGGGGTPLQPLAPPITPP